MELVRYAARDSRCGDRKGGAGWASVWLVCVRTRCGRAHGWQGRGGAGADSLRQPARQQQPAAAAAAAAAVTHPLAALAQPVGLPREDVQQGDDDALLLGAGALLSTGGDAAARGPTAALLGGRGILGGAAAQRRGIAREGRSGQAFCQYSVAHVANRASLSQLPSLSSGACRGCRRRPCWCPSSA